jgi:hypothetical protein
MNTKDGFVQGFNAQAVAIVDQFVIAAEEVCCTDR